MPHPIDEPTQSPRSSNRQVAADAPAQPSPSVALRASYGVIEEDVRKANELAATLEAQLAGKSKEVLHLKFLFEQTKTHLGHLQDSITAMRAERHKLANDSMRATGLEMMLKQVTAERDRLKKELEGVLEGLAVEKAQSKQGGLRFDDRDQRIAELTFEVMTLRQEGEELRRRLQASAPAPVTPQAIPPGTSAGVEEKGGYEAVEIVATERVTRRRA